MGGKEELFQEAVRGGVEANLTEVERILKLDETPDEKLRMIVTQSALRVRGELPAHVRLHPGRHAQGVLRVQRLGEGDEPSRAGSSGHVKLIKQAIDDGSFRNDVRPELAANALFGMVNWTHRWFKPGKKTSAADVTDAFWTIFFDGMKKDA